MSPDQPPPVPHRLPVPREDAEPPEALPAWRQPSVPWVLGHIAIGGVALPAAAGALAAFLIVVWRSDQAILLVRPGALPVALGGLAGWLLFVYLRRGLWIRSAVLAAFLAAGTAGTSAFWIADSRAGTVLPPRPGLADSRPDPLWPRFSPDGRRIAFSSDHEGNDEIYVFDLESGRIDRLTSDPAADLDPDWSPDGRHIVLDADPQGLPTLFMMEADGSARRPVPGAPPGSIFPDWSPGGDQIVFSCGPNFDGLDICLIAASGKGFRLLTSSPDARDWEPSWSPDGTRVAFSSDMDGDFEIYVLDVATGAVDQITSDPGRDGDPVWSPDGTMLAFDSDRGGGQVFLVHATGGQPTQLTHESQGATTPTWSPDGAWIVYRAITDDGPVLVIVAPDGMGRRQILP